MGHKYTLEINSDNIEKCCDQLIEYFHDINSNDVPPLDVAASTYKTVAQQMSDANYTHPDELPKACS